MPGRRRGSSSARAAASRNLAAKSDVLPSCRSTRSFNSAGAGSSHSVSSGSSVSGRRMTKPSSVHMVSTSMPRSARSLRGDGHAPRRVHAAAEGGEHADAQIAELVAAALDHDVAVAGHAAGGGGLIFQVAQQIFGGVGVEAVLFHQAREGGGARHGEQFARHLADLAAEFGGASGAVAVPEGHLAGLAGRGRDADAIVRDLIDAPGGGAEDDGVAGAALEDHLLIEFADARAARGAGEEDAEEAAIGDGAAVDDGDAAARPARAVSWLATRSQVMRGRSSANSSEG